MCRGRPGGHHLDRDGGIGHQCCPQQRCDISAYQSGTVALSGAYSNAPEGWGLRGAQSNAPVEESPLKWVMPAALRVGQAFPAT